MIFSTRACGAIAMLVSLWAETVACGTNAALLGNGPLSDGGLPHTGNVGMTDGAVGFDGGPSAQDGGVDGAPAATDAGVADGETVSDSSTDAGFADTGSPQCTASYPPDPLIPCLVEDGGAVSFVSCQSDQFTCPAGSSLPTCAGESDTFLCVDVCGIGSEIQGQPTCGTYGWLCPSTAPYKTTECLNGCAQYLFPDCCDSAGNLADYACASGQLTCPGGTTTCICPENDGIPYCCDQPGGTISYSSCGGSGAWQCAAPQTIEVSCCSGTMNTGLGAAACTPNGWECPTGYAPCADGGA
jgi:hypothetical protein